MLILPIRFKESFAGYFNGLGKDAALIISRLNGFTHVETSFDYRSGKLTVVSEKPIQKDQEARFVVMGWMMCARVLCYGRKNVDVSITGNSTNPPASNIL